MLDIAVSVYSPNGQTCLVNDVVTAGGGTNSPIYKAKYEDTPDGGGAGELTLGLRYNEFYDLGYWSWRNLVEISSGDNFLTAATAATPSGSLKCYIDALWGFDPARGEDAQLAYLNDGVNKVVRCPVQSIGFDSAPAIVHNASTTTTTAATSITRGIATPTAGNRLIAILATNSVGTTGPSGWTSAGGTSVTGGLGLAMWYKTAAGTETSVSVTLASAQTATLTVMEVSGGGVPTFAFDAAPDTQVGPALRSPAIATTPIGSLVVAAFAIENGAQLVAPYGWTTTIPNNPSPTTATNYALGLAAVSATDTNPYQAYASFATYGATNLGACAAIIAIPPSGTPNPWITIGQPAGGGGIPAYAAAVTTVGRRRYCGMVTKRTRPNQKMPGGTVTLTGLQNALQGAIGTFNIALAAAQDVGATCYNAFTYIPPGAVGAANFATSHFPFLSFPGSLPSPLYPPTGSVYSGNNSQISVDQFLAYVIAATTADGDQWNLRVGHDRTPRLAKYFDGTTDVYLYNVTLDQSSWSFSALAVQTVDEQDNGTYNAVEVVGATGTTGVQASAIVLNTTQIANLGYQIDGTPQYNTALTTTAQCAAQAESLLESNSTAAAANTCTIFTHYDLVTSSCAPGGMQRGDVVRAGANLTLTGFPGDAPNQSGLVLSVVTTLDFQKMESQQDVSFQAIVPDYRTAAAEQANALATSLLANQNKLVAVDQYCVSSNARNYGTSVASLTISFPAILAIFAPSTTGTQTPISIAAANVTCTANASNWIWLNPNGTYSVYQTNALVTGSILMLVAQMGASGWVGDSGLVASIGVIQVGLGNVNVAANLPAPTLSGHTIANGTALSGLATIVNDTVTYTNAPTDGSATQLVYYYAATGTGNWIAGMEINLYIAPGATYPSASHTLGCQLDLNNGSSYDFAVGYAGIAGYGPLTQYATNIAVTAISVPISYQPGGTATTPAFSGVSVTNGTSYDGIHADVVVSFTITNQPQDASLSAIQLWVRVSARGGSNVPGASTFYWGAAGGQPAYGVGGAPGSCPASGTYYFAIPNVINGSVVDIGASFENAQGGQSTVGVLQSSFTAVALDIPVSATAFANLLTEQFPGLSIDPTTGLLEMPATGTASFYPYSQSLTLGAYAGLSTESAPIRSYVTFVMKFQLTSTSPSSIVAAGIFTNAVYAGYGFSNGYDITYTPGSGSSPATVEIFKEVAGTLVPCIARNSAIAASGIYPAVPAIPAADLNMHELRVIVIPGSGLIVPAPGITIEVYLDSVLIMSFAESTTTAAVTTGPSLFGFGGNVGGVAPYTSGTCGPGTNGSYLVYLDPQDLTVSGELGSRRYDLGVSQAHKSQAKIAFTGSTTPLETGVVQRESIDPRGSANLVRNPRFQNSLVGWSLYTTAPGGNAGTIGLSTYFGGSATVVSGPSRGSTAYLDELYQTINTNSFGYTNGVPITASVCAYIANLYAGATVSLAWADSSGGSGTLQSVSVAGYAYLSGTFTPTSGATTINILLQVTSAGNSATGVYWYDPKIEFGVVATPYRDDNATSLLALTHEVELGATGSFRSQIVQDRHIAPSVPRKNLIVNGNNCAGTGDTAPSTFGWKGAYNTTAVPFSGGNYGPFLSIGFTKTSTASAQGYYQDVPVTPGQTYTFQTLFYDVVGTVSPTMWIGKSDYSVQYNASPGVPVNAATIPAFYSSAATHANANSTTSTAGWAHLYGTFTVPSGVSSVRVLMYDPGSVASQSFYANGIMLTEGARLQDYIDHEGNAGSIANRHLSSSTQDGLTDGTYYRRPYNLPHQGANLVENPYFAVAAQSPTTEVAANWACLPTPNIAYNGGAGWTTGIETNTAGQALIGSNDVLCRYNIGVTIPASSTYSNRITTERVFAALPGDSFVLNVHYSIASLASLPAGVQLNLHFGFYRYFSDGTNDVGAGAVGLVNLPNVSTTTSGYVTASTTYTVPQPVSKSVVGLTVTLEIEIQNTTGSSYTTTNYVADVRFGYVQCYRLVNLPSEVTGQLPYANDSTATQAAISSAGALQGVNTAMIGPYGTTPGFSTINSSQTFTPSLTITIPSYGSWFVEIEWTARCTYTSLAIAATSTGTMGTPSSINAPNTTTVATTGVAKYIVTATGAQTITATLTATTGNFTGAACATGIYITRMWRYA